MQGKSFAHHLPDVEGGVTPREQTNVDEAAERFQNPNVALQIGCPNWIENDVNPVRHAQNLLGKIMRVAVNPKRRTQFFAAFDFCVGSGSYKAGCANCFRHLNARCADTACAGMQQQGFPRFEIAVW